MRPVSSGAQGTPGTPPPVADAQFQAVSVADAVQRLEAVARPDGPTTALPASARDPAPPRLRLKQPASATLTSCADDTVESVVESAVNGSVKSAVDGDVGSSVESSFENAVESPVESPASPVESPVESPASPVESPVESAVNANFTVKSAVKSAVNGTRKPHAVLRKQVSFSDLVLEIPLQADDDNDDSPDVAPHDDSLHQVRFADGGVSGRRVPGAVAEDVPQASTLKTNPSPMVDQSLEAGHSPETNPCPEVDQSLEVEARNSPYTSPSPTIDSSTKEKGKGSTKADLGPEGESKTNLLSQSRLPIGVNKPQNGEKPELPHRLSLRGMIIPDILPVNMLRSHPKLKKATDVSKGSKAPYRSVPLCLPSPASASE
ncbi:proline-rich protein 36-like [Thrips palmi]|uniref:Proline-rich protein 36-like n=1 Tax=Thrips palmi TaxID=161013 RepID=A0A6P8YBC6_THRPL|nr:proline-rich protein 36-like [Thrips palmi]